METSMRVLTFNPLYDKRDRYAIPQPQYITYEGDSVPAPKWAAEGTIALATGNPLWPVRLIDPSLIIEINGDVAVEAKPDPTTRTVTVEGSKGQNYVVTITPTGRSCTCQGFAFRNKCKHLKIACV